MQGLELLGLRTGGPKILQGFRIRSAAQGEAQLLSRERKLREGAVRGHGRSGRASEAAWAEGQSGAGHQRMKAEGFTVGLGRKGSKT